MVCHSERSEESSESRLAAAKWILRYAQNDNPLFSSRFFAAFAVKIFVAYR